MLRHLGGYLGLSEAPRGPLGGLLGASRVPFGGLLGLLGALFGLSWEPPGGPGGPLGAILEAVSRKSGGTRFAFPPWGPRSS
eukprot:7468599-Pyramimonas_sp.AAC.1